MNSKKFRAWDKKLERYIKRSDLRDPFHISVKPTKYGFALKTTFILEQFAGIFDKNEKEIYFDSDIVEYGYEDCEGIWQTVIGTVILDLKFTNSLCVKVGSIFYHFTASESRNIKIIGNIHRNPDLLKTEVE